MEDWQMILIGFGITNLGLLIFCRPLSGILLRLFAFARSFCPPEEAEKRATKMGFSGSFFYDAHKKITQKKVIQFLAWSGGINFVGCIAFYFWIASGFFNGPEPPAAPSSSTAPSSGSMPSGRGTDD